MKREAEVESCCVRRSNYVKPIRKLMLEILRLTNCICEARDLGLVRLLPMIKSTEKFEFERKHSQRLGA